MTTSTLTAVDRLLDAFRAGHGVPAALFAPGAVLDATVPGWRFSVEGPDAVARQYSGWFDLPCELEELERHPVEGGEVVTYLQSLVDQGVPYAAHHCHVLRFDAEGRIAGDLFFCGGRWDAARLAEMAAAQHAASVAARHA
ncbi:MAG: hypothetical protein QOG43_3447 [Actinomycetota bacterium]|jgi:hypothetical protein|nr:hypothetical protein [Actinomycetota bacterium]